VQYPEEHTEQIGLCIVITDERNVRSWKVSHRQHLFDFVTQVMQKHVSSVFRNEAGREKQTETAKHTHTHREKHLETNNDTGQIWCMCSSCQFSVETDHDNHSYPSDIGQRLPLTDPSASTCRSTNHSSRSTNCIQTHCTLSQTVNEHSTLTLAACQTVQTTARLASLTLLHLFT